MRKGIFITLLVLAAAPFALAANDGPAEPDRYVSGEGESLFINQSQVLEQELPLIFVRKADGGSFDLLVPRPDQPELLPLWRATQKWVSDADNLDDLSRQIELESALAKTSDAVIDGKLSQLEHINYAIGRWLEGSGATAEIRRDARPRRPDSRSRMDSRTASGAGGIQDIAFTPQDPDPSPMGCSNIPVCTSCQSYVCGYIGPWYHCNCHAWGQTCCVINLNIRPRQTFEGQN